MNILIDHHHGALLRSMSILFSKRLNYNVFVPFGMEWLDEERLYSCYPNRDTSDQMLNSWVLKKEKLNFVPLSLEAFKNNSFDVIVCSLFENYEIFKQLIAKYNKKCKLVLQVGNNISPVLVESSQVSNLLCSAYPIYVLSNVKNKVMYHQEFDLELFIPTKPNNIRSIANFKHIMEDDVHFMNELEKRLNNWEFKYYGAKNRDGILDDSDECISDVMKQFGFVFHVKKDEGYGHVIHNAFACGKPSVVDLNKSVFRFNNNVIKNTASFLFEKNLTVIDFNEGIDVVSDKLKVMADNYDYYSSEVYKKFRSVVDFDKEELEIRTFIENLI